MPNTYNKSNPIGLKMENLYFIDDSPKEMYYQCIKSLFYSAILTYDAIDCECCGIKNE